MWYLIGLLLVGAGVVGVVLWRRRARPEATSDDLASQTQQRLRWLNGEFIKYLESKEAALVQRMARGTSGGTPTDAADPLSDLD